MHASLLSLTRARLLLRWPHNAAQVELSLSSGVRLFNAVFLSNRSEYYRKSCIAEKYILLAIFVPQKVWV